MKSELRKIKNFCKTPSQMRAFNRIISAFTEEDRAKTSLSYGRETLISYKVPDENEESGYAVYSANFTSDDSTAINQLKESLERQGIKIEKTITDTPKEAKDRMEEYWKEKGVDKIKFA